jgi:septal ring factor EnvC (AmiA/AmiB activator)
MQWLDCEQSEQDKRYVEETGRSTREKWKRMVEAEKQEQKRKERQEEIRIRRKIKEREAAAAREADRERKRERARRAKEAGPDAMRKGKYPVVPSRRRVLDAKCYCIHKKLCFHFIIL